MKTILLEHQNLMVVIVARIVLYGGIQNSQYHVSIVPHSEIDKMKFPFILVLHEKHGDYYYLMNEAEDVQKFAMEVLISRFEAGYYCKPNPVQDTFEEYFKGVHGMSVEDAEQLAEKHGQNIQLGNRSPAAEIKSMKSAYTYRLVEVKEYDQIESAVNEKNAALAWKIVYNRSNGDYQYEEFSMERIENL